MVEVGKGGEEELHAWVLIFENALVEKLTFWEGGCVRRWAWDDGGDDVEV